MKLGASAWLDQLRDLGSAFLEVLKAEATAFGADLTASRRQAIRAVLVMTAALILAGWAVALLSLALIAYLQQYLPTWLAVLSVAGALLVAAVSLLFWGRSLLDQVRGPGELLQSRLRDHTDWLRSQVDSIETSNAKGESNDL